MKRILWIAVVALVAGMVAAAPATAGSGVRGAHDAYWFHWMHDADGDGIPNGLDPDWVRPLDGTGYQMHWGAVFVVRPSSDGQRTMLWYRAGERQRAMEALRIRLRTQLRLRDGSCRR